MSLLTNAQNLLHFQFLTPAHAAGDGVRAFQVLPLYMPKSAKGNLLWKRVKTGAFVFGNNLKMRLRKNVHITALGTEGLFANYLQVLQVLRRLRPDGNAKVDWTLTGDEPGFRYGQIGEDVWSHLFKLRQPAPQGPCWQPHHFLDLTLWRAGKDYLRGDALQQQRYEYNKVINDWIEVTNPRVLAETEHYYEQFMRNNFCVGVHRRVVNGGTTFLQASRKMPTTEEVIERAKDEIRNSGAASAVVYLATDDREAVEKFREAFGDRLVVREEVQRTTSNDAEVHWQDWGKLSLVDAEDPLIDALLLAKCDVMLHVSSSVSTAVSFMNPNLRLVRV